MFSQWIIHGIEFILSMLLGLQMTITSYKPQVRYTLFTPTILKFLIVLKNYVVINRVL